MENILPFPLCHQARSSATIYVNECLTPMPPDPTKFTPTELFSIFTADIIGKKVLFWR